MELWQQFLYNVWQVYIERNVNALKGRIQGGGKGAVPPPRTQSYHTFQILNWRVKNIKKIILLFWIGGLKGALPPTHNKKKYIIAVL